MGRNTSTLIPAFRSRSIPEYERRYRKRLRLTIGELRTGTTQGTYWSTDDNLRKLLRYRLSIEDMKLILDVLFVYWRCSSLWKTFPQIFECHRHRFMSCLGTQPNVLYPSHLKTLYNQTGQNHSFLSVTDVVSFKVYFQWNKERIKKQKQIKSN